MRDLPILDAETHIHLQRFRVDCPDCGRSREDIRPCFELLGAEGRQRIAAVAMDMDAAYEAEVQEQCPQAEIVYD